MIFGVLITLGIMPSFIAWGIFWGTMLVNVPWAVAVLILFKVVTPVLKRSGLYVGTLSDYLSRRKASKTP
jgi:hypothetical protein